MAAKTFPFLHEFNSHYKKIKIDDHENASFLLNLDFLCYRQNYFSVNEGPPSITGLAGEGGVMLQGRWPYPPNRPETVSSKYTVS